RIFDVVTKSPLGEPKSPYSFSADFSEDGSHVFTLANGVVTVWPVGEEAQPYRMTSRGYVNSALWYGDSTESILLSLANSIDLSNINEESMSDIAEASAAKASRDGKKILSIQKEGLTGLVQIWDRNPNTSAVKVRTSIPLDSLAKTAEFDPTGNYIITISD